MNWLLEHPYLRPSLYFALIMALLGLSSWLLRPLLIPLIFAFILYAILDPVTNSLVRRGFNQTRAILIILGILVVFMLLMLIIGVPEIINQVSDFKGRLPQIYDRLHGLIDSLLLTIQTRTGIDIDQELILGILPGFLRSGGSEVLSTATSLMTQIGTAVVLIPLLTFFLLRDFRGIRNQMMGLLPNRSFELGWLIYSRVVKQLQGYIRGVLTQSAIMALITTSGFALIGLEMAVLLGLFAGLLNIIPYVGPLLAMIPPIFIILAGDASPLWLIFSAICVVALAQIIDNVVVIPSLIANAADLHPLTVLIGIVVAGFFFGFVGMIIAIPLMFTTKIIFLGLLNGISGQKRIQ